MGSVVPGSVAAECEESGNAAAGRDGLGNVAGASLGVGGMPPPWTSGEGTMGVGGRGSWCGNQPGKSLNACKDGLVDVSVRGAPPAIQSDDDEAAPPPLLP